MKVCKIFEWDAAHQLKLPYESKCKNMHGHTYKVEIELEGQLNANGMVMDFSKLESILESANFDHKTINEIEWFKETGFNPTAENLVHFINNSINHKALKANNIEISRIRVWETPTSYAEENY